MRGAAALPLRVQGRAVVVGLSGGVDSAVCAALLQEAGACVQAVWLRFFDGPAADRAWQDAEGVGQQLGLAVQQVDCRALFQTAVIDPFVSAYCNCRTPSPCCVCNPEVKIRALCTAADDLGAELLATGHYAQLLPAKAGPLLVPGADDRRDQSYFLYRLTVAQRRRLVLPLGLFSKEQVRDYAAARGLALAQKEDSQDICFLAASGQSYAEFIAGRVQGKAPALEAGEIIGPGGCVLGQHRGTLHYTIGQRHGLGVSADAPLYVTRLEERRVHVGYRADTAVWEAGLEDFFWSAEPQKGMESQVWCQFRSTMRPEPAVLCKASGGWRVRWLAVQHGVAPGQVAVLRDGRGGILGGGLIASTA